MSCTLVINLSAYQFVKSVKYSDNILPAFPSIRNSNMNTLQHVSIWLIVLIQ